MTAPHPLDAAECPLCGRSEIVYRRRAGRMICIDCYRAEEAKDAACTCTTTGHCEVCR